MTCTISERIREGLRRIKVSRPARWAANLKIRQKLFLCMLLVTTCALGIISLINYIYLSNYTGRQEELRTGSTVKLEKQSFSKLVDSFYHSVDIFLASDNLKSTLSDVSDKDTDAYLTDYLNLQDDFQKLADSDSLIDSVMILGRNGEFYSSMEYGLNQQSVFSEWFGVQVKGMTWLSVRQNPLDGSQVIPVVLPVVYQPFMIGDTDQATALIYIFIHADQFNATLQEINKNTDSMVYLANGDGTPLNVTKAGSSYREAFSDVLVRLVRNSKASEEARVRVNRNIYNATIQNLDFCNLRLVILNSENRVLEQARMIGLFTLLIWVAVLGLAAMLAVFLARTISRPLYRLAALARTSQGDIPVIIHTGDEIGFLNRSLNEMSGVIHRQILTIRREEREKASAEIRALSEQINRHFLFNTLECIHMEMLSGRTEDAAGMLEAFGEYLRLGLSGGRSMISLRDEIRHSTEYVRIMNYRLKKTIRFAWRMPDELRQILVPKLILQPLVENSIRHGFTGDAAEATVQDPRITVSVRTEGERMQIIVEDNGVGIDMTRARQAVDHVDENQPGKIGLHNVYRRLQFFYDRSVSVSFQSTPYYQNRVIVDFPFRKIRPLDPGTPIPSAICQK